MDFLRSLLECSVAKDRVEFSFAYEFSFIYESSFTYEFFFTGELSFAYEFSFCSLLQMSSVFTYKLFCIYEFFLNMSSLVYFMIKFPFHVWGCLRLVGSLKSQVSFAEYCLFYRALLQKRIIISRSLLIVATP